MSTLTPVRTSVIEALRPDAYLPEGFLDALERLDASDFSDERHRSSAKIAEDGLEPTDEFLDGGYLALNMYLACLLYLFIKGGCEPGQVGLAPSKILDDYFLEPRVVLNRRWENLIIPIFGVNVYHEMVPAGTPAGDLHATLRELFQEQLVPWEFFGPTHEGHKIGSVCLAVAG